MWGLFIRQMKKFIILLIFIITCSTIQHTEDSKLDPVIDAKIEEIENSGTMTPQEKSSTLAIIESLRQENKSLRILLSDRDKIVANQGKKIQELQTQLAACARDAGKSDGLSGLAWWIFGLLGFGVVFLAGYIFLKTKFKIPGVS